MFLDLLFASPMFALVWVVAILSALTFHEFAHAWVGKLRGDDTAEHLGRLTLNPLAHIDPLGFILLLFAGFGWAKPVPFDPRQLRQPVKDGLLIALAGPAANLVFAVVAGLLLRFLLASGIMVGTNLLAVFLLLLVAINLMLAVFNMIPVHPLDGSKILDAVFSAPRYRKFLHAMELYGPRVLLVLVFISLAVPGVEIFSFIRYPANWICTLILGDCSAIFGT